MGLLCYFTGLYCDALQVRVETGWGHPGSGQVGLTQIIKYPGLTRILHWIMCRDQPIMCLLLPIMLCYSALKIHLLCSIVCSRTEIAVRLLCFYMLHYMSNSLHVTDNFKKTVLLECITEVPCVGKYWRVKTLANG